MCLSQIGDARAVEPLIHALHDVYGYVRREAALALGEIGDNSALQPLINNICTDDKSAAAAAKALSKLTDETVQDILLKWS
ncbi:HEAT repeat domain-containing protein [bacterium]|nr:HEAT repeat domain-containing protein [bacterium]